MNAIVLDTDLISLKEVERSTGYKKSSIYQKVKDGEFPPPKKMGTRTSRWVRGDIEAWKKQFL